MKPEQRRALEMLAGTPRGATKAVLIHGYGFAPHMLDDLIRDGLAMDASERFLIGTNQIIVEVRRIRITDTGRQALG